MTTNLYIYLIVRSPSNPVVKKKKRKQIKKPQSTKTGAIYLLHFLPLHSLLRKKSVLSWYCF